jgi:hypothetical protein
VEHRTARRNAPPTANDPGSVTSAVRAEGLVGIGIGWVERRFSLAAADTADTVPRAPSCDASRWAMKGRLPGLAFRHRADDDPPALSLDAAETLASAA